MRDLQRPVHRNEQTNTPQSAKRTLQRQELRSKRSSQPESKIGYDNIEIIDRADSETKLLIKEAIYINKEKPAINTQLMSKKQNNAHNAKVKTFYSLINLNLIIFNNRLIIMFILV